MNYRQQAAKENPFEGLSERDAKKMVVYFNHFAEPTMTGEAIFRKYGFVLPQGTMGLHESLQLMPEVMQELTGIAAGSAESSARQDSGYGANSLASKSGTTSNTGCCVPLVLLLGVLILGLGAACSGCNKENDRSLYSQVKQFDNDVKRGRYTPIETPDGKIRYQKNP